MKDSLSLILGAFIALSVQIIPQFSMAQQKIIQDAGRNALGGFAPEFARLNDDVLFGEIWSRNDLFS